MLKKFTSTIIFLSFLTTVGIVSLSQAAETSTPKNSRKVVDIVCVQTAVEKRENAVATAWSSLNSSVTAAMAARKEVLKTAWAITDANQRRTAIKTAWTNFKTADKTARTTFRKAQKAAWAQFKTDAKACRATATYETEGQDIQL